VNAHEELAHGLLDEDVEELYEHAPAGYFSTLLDGTIVKANATLLSWLRYARDELVGQRRLHDLLPPGARIYYETHYAPLLQMQGRISEIALELVRSDGSRLPVLLNSTLVRDGDGRARVVRTTAVDASDRRRYERELLRARADAESRARAALALDHVAEGVLLVGENGNVEVINPAAEAILGVNAATAVGRPANDTLLAWDAIAHVRVRRRGELPAPDFVPVARGRGEQWLSVAAVGAGDGTVYTLRDVTAERDLDRVRSDIIAIVSHELRTPLTGVYGAAQTLLARFETLDDATRRSFLELVVSQSERLGKIVEQMLVASTVDTEALPTEAASFDAAAVFDTIVQALDGDARLRVIVTAPTGVFVRGDLDRLRQVISNLLDNALKYSSGAVRVAAEPRDLAVRFTVADEGPGIPPADRDRVFERFVRLDPDQYGGVGGTGLGLYIARELVQRMSGRIGLLPRERGSTFFVDVPRAG
jgi:PAS domain S-box-containing protein